MVVLRRRQVATLRLLMFGCLMLGTLLLMIKLIQLKLRHFVHGVSLC